MAYKSFKIPLPEGVYPKDGYDRLYHEATNDDFIKNFPTLKTKHLEYGSGLIIFLKEKSKSMKLNDIQEYIASADQLPLEALIEKYDLNVTIQLFL
jgi:hypothetical protein